MADQEVDKRFAEALAAGTLMRLARELKAEGMSQKAMFALFDRHRALHHGDGDEAFYNSILATMDCITGWCSADARLFDSDLTDA